MPTNADRQSVKAEVVAKYILAKMKENGNPISNKKLQKLLYYSQAWCLVLKGKPLFIDDIQAWVHGPAVPAVYRNYKEYGLMNIPVTFTSSSVELESELKEVIDMVLGAYGKYDAYTLESLTHSELPWQQTRGKLLPYENTEAVIPVEVIRSYYVEVFSKQKEKRA